jgi:4-amino-4-deoxy-L-arabinose transferase-like glycosyltransferase
MPHDASRTEGVRRTKASWWLWLAAIVTLAGAAQWWTQSQLGPVNDELANFPSGVALVHTGLQADPTHPPLARYLMAMPLLVAGVDPRADHPSLGTDWHPYGRDFLFRNNLPWRTILDLARFPILLLCMGLVVVVAWEAKRRWGAAAGLAAAATLAFEPSILGHGTLATTDLALTFVVFLSVLAFDRFLRAPSGPRLMIVAVTVTAAILTKFAGILLVPILGVTAIAHRLTSEGRFCRSLASSNQSQVGQVTEVPTAVSWPRCRWWALALALSALLAWAAYGFEVRSMSQDRQLTATREAAAIRDSIAQIAPSFGLTTDQLMDVPIPAYSLLKGFGAQMFHAARQDAWEDRDFYQYLDGNYDRNGFATYYLRTFLYKSTLPSLVLWAGAALAGIWLILRRKKPGNDVPGWPALAIPPVLWVAACSIQTINIGHRYVLPAIPFLSLGAGWLVARLWDDAAAMTRSPGISGGKRARIAASASAAVALLAAHAGIAISTAPHHIAYFNTIAGGIQEGGLHLADSNLDWGQDLPALDADARRHCASGRTCIAAVFGTARPEDYETPVTPWLEPMDPSTLQGTSTLPGKSTFYVSENRFLLRSLAHPDGLFPFLRNRQPVRRVGASIRVYEFP